MMICVNAFTNVEPRPVEAIRTLLILLSPFAPHLAEEIWHQLRNRFSGFVGLVSKQPWPSWNEEYLAEDEVEVIIQVNGKLRDKMTVAKDLDEASLERLAQTSAKVQASLRGKSVVKVVVVPNRIVNLVAR
jgi:leucyl-tRNA synthetase